MFVTGVDPRTVAELDHPRSRCVVRTTRIQHPVHNLHNRPTAVIHRERPHGGGGCMVQCGQKRASGGSIFNVLLWTSFTDYPLSMPTTSFSLPENKRNNTSCHKTALCSHFRRKATAQWGRGDGLHFGYNVGQSFLILTTKMST